MHMDTSGDVPRPRRIGLPWYAREDYARVRAAMADPHNLAPVYDGWLMAALNNEAVAKQAGLQVVRAFIDPDRFPQWCAEKGLEADARARARFAQQAAEAVG
jgi:hypothetical protein